MDLSIIIISFNTNELIRSCLKSVYSDLGQSSLKAEVVVVDNASSDDSVQTIRKEFPNVHLILNKENVGFGRANNQAVALAKGKLLLFLNSDTTIRKGTLSKMNLFFDQNVQVGIASCQLRNADGTIQPQGGWLPRLSTVAIWAWFLDDLPVLKQILPSYQLRRLSLFTGFPKSIGWVGGTAMWVRRRAWTQLGEFDEQMFMYGEDVELCYRARALKWEVMINPHAQIVHIGGASSASPRWITGEVDGLIHIFKTHKPRWEMPILRIILLSGMLFRWFIFGILGRNETLRAGYAAALHHA